MVVTLLIMSVIVWHFAGCKFEGGYCKSDADCCSTDEQPLACNSDTDMCMNRTGE